MKLYMNFGYPAGDVICYLHDQRRLYTDQETGNKSLRALVAESLMNLVALRVITPRKAYLLYRQYRHRKDIE